MAGLEGSARMSTKGVRRPVVTTDRDGSALMSKEGVRTALTRGSSTDNAPRIVDWTGNNPEMRGGEALR